MSWFDNILSLAEQEAEEDRKDGLGPFAGTIPPHAPGEDDE